MVNGKESTFQIVGEILSCKEQGGSRNDKNLSVPIMKKRRLQIAVITFIIFIDWYFWRLLFYRSY